MLIFLVSVIYVASGESLFHTDDSEGNFRMKNENSRPFHKLLYKLIVKAIKQTYIVNTI